MAIASNLTAFAIAIGKNHPLLRGVNVVLGVFQVILGTELIGKALGATSTHTVNDFFLSARTWVAPRVDPLILDLDGDGIETVGIRPGAAVLFDHDGDGTRTGSGWVKADVGILVLDLDGNGQIDSGRELFGDQTLVQSGPNAGQRAANGFAALAQYDANADGRIDSADALYSQLQVWQDLNQDGISQSNELKTLGQLGIASIQVSGTARNTALADATTGMASGNTLQTSGSFTRVDGSVGVRCECAVRVRRKLRMKNGMSPRQPSIVCYRTKSRQRNKDWRGLASLVVSKGARRDAGGQKLRVEELELESTSQSGALGS